MDRTADILRWSKVIGMSKISLVLEEAEPGPAITPEKRAVLLQAPDVGMKSAIIVA